MKRQKIRKAGILVSFLLFPITIFYMSPVLIVEGAARGIVAGSFIVFGFQLLSGLILGRAFCGWVCPGAGLQEACSVAQNRRVRTGKADWSKYFIWTPWIIAIAIAAIYARGFHTLDPLFMTRKNYGISVGEPFNYIVYYFFIALIIVLAFAVGRRAFCHYVCWMAPFMVIGRKVCNVFRWPALRLKSEQDTCSNCGTCTKNCPMSLDVEQMVQNGNMEHSECILCGTCVDQCPTNTIRYSFSS